MENSLVIEPKALTRNTIQSDSEDFASNCGRDFCHEPKLTDKVLLEKVKEKGLLGVPLQEIDLSFLGKNTFVVITENGWLHRFKREKSLWIFQPFNPFRRCAIYYDTVFRDTWINFIFWFLIVFDVFSLLIPLRNTESIIIYRALLLAIFMNDLFLKLIARGGITHEFAALRDPWTWLDLLIIEILEFVLPCPELTVLSRSIMPIKIIYYCRERAETVLESFVQLVTLLKIICIPFIFISIPTVLIFTILETHRSKMMQNFSVNETDKYALFSPEKLFSNPQIIQSDFGWSFLKTLSLLTQDSLDRHFPKDFQADLLQNVLFYSTSFFFGVFPLGVFVYGVIADRFIANINSIDKALEKFAPKTEILPEQPIQPLPTPRITFGLRKILFHWIFEDFIRIILLLQIFLLLLYYYGVWENLPLFKCIIFFNYYYERLFIMEIVVKLIALGRQFFKSKKNSIDFWIAILITINLSLYYMDFDNFNVFIILLFRNLYWWPQINFFYNDQPIRNPHRFYWILMLFFGITIPYLGQGLFQDAFEQNFDKFEKQQLPRWNYIDFGHSLVSSFRILYGEWTSTFLNCFIAKNFSYVCILFYIVAMPLGSLIVMTISVIIITRTMGLMTNYEKFCLASDKSKSIFNFPKMFITTLKSHTRALITLSNMNTGNSSGNGKTTLKEIRKEIGTTWISHRICKILSIFVILISSINLGLEINFRKEKQQPFIFMYVVEWIFTTYFAGILALRYMDNRSSFCRSLKSKTFLFELILVLDQILSLLMCDFFKDDFLSQGILRLRCFRLFLLTSWICNLQKVVKALTNQLNILIGFAPFAFFTWIFVNLIFVQLMNGKFHKCLDSNNTKANHFIIKDKAECIANNFTWVNSPDNFDNAFSGFKTLVSIATLESSWTRVVADSVDSREQDMQPYRENNFAFHFMFIYFFYLCVLLTISMGSGIIAYVIVQGKGSKLFLTENQWKLYLDLKLENNKNQTPKQMTAFKYFGLGITLFDLFCLGGLEYSKSQKVECWFKYMYYICSSLIAIEISVKVYRKRLKFFQNFWDRVDLIVLIRSVVGVIISGGNVSPVPRIFRMMFLYRLLPFVPFSSLSVLKKFQKALKLVIPALFNLLFFLIVLFYSFLLHGLSIFKDTYNEHGHFNTFLNGFSILFKATFLSGWSTVINEMKEEVDWFSSDTKNLSIVEFSYFLIYLGSCLLIFINMYALAILEFASQFSANPTNFFCVHSSEQEELAETRTPLIMNLKPEDASVTSV